MTRPRHVVGIDPGRHVGMCLFLDDMFIEGREAHGIEEVSETLTRWTPEILIVEDFLGGHAHTNHRDPLTILGAVLHWAFQNEVEVTLQSPSILRVYLPKTPALHPSRHVRCAAAHVRYYLSRPSAA